MSELLRARVDLRDGALSVPGSLVDNVGEKAWEARQMGRRVLLQPLSFADLGQGARPDDQGYCSIDTFLKLLASLHESKFQGSVHADIGIAVKTLFFNKGELVFASSNLIDDRLGEVCYRDSLISLEALLNTTVQVDKSIKFGQVLLRDRIFSNLQLQQALCFQVVHIARSLFMAESVYFETFAGAAAPLQVVQDASFHDFLRQSHAYGAMYRDFKSRIELDSSVVVDEGHGEVSKEFPPGTFHGDLLILIRENTYISNIIQFSKLHELNTLAAIMHLFNLGAVKVDPISPRDPSLYSPGCGRLKSALDVYSFIIQKAQELFSSAGKEFPVADLKLMLALTSDAISYHSLEPNLRFSGECVHRMMVQGSAADGRIAFFERQIDRLTQFVIQVTMDTLSFVEARDLKKLYDQMSAG